MDARNCNEVSESELVSNFQSMCQKHYKAAKEASKNIYNRILHHYNYSYSFSTVVYSDRYFVYNLTLETKTMPMKCFIADDLSRDLIYKRFTSTYRNHVNVFKLDSDLNDDDPCTKHYMPIFTNWGIQPYAPFGGVLFDFGDRYLLFYTDRRYYYSSFFDDIQQFYDKNRLNCQDYRPAIDMYTCSREMLDYDDFVYSHFKLGEMNRKQMQPLFHHERKSLHYRSPEKGHTTDFKKFTNYEISSKRKKFKKNNSYSQALYGRTNLVSKFPLPDFALSKEDLTTRWKNCLYEKNKMYEPSKIYEKLYKPGRHVSISNLALIESELKDKKNNKIYSLDKKLNLNQTTNNSGNDSLTIESNKNNLGLLSHIDFKKELNKSDLTKFSGGIADILSATSNERGLLLMEPMVIMQNLNEERLKNKILSAKKTQRMMVYIIIGYTLFFIISSFVVFYVLYFK